MAVELKHVSDPTKLQRAFRAAAELKHASSLTKPRQQVPGADSAGVSCDRSARRRSSCNSNRHCNRRNSCATRLCRRRAAAQARICNSCNSICRRSSSVQARHCNSCNGCNTKGEPIKDRAHSGQPRVSERAPRLRLRHRLGWRDDDAGDDVWQRCHRRRGGGRVR